MAAGWRQGGRNRSDTGRRSATGSATCTGGGTRTDTARLPAHGHAHASPRAPLLPTAARACPHARRQPHDAQPHARVCARPRLGGRPRCLPPALTCTGTTSPCPAGRGACAARRGARSTAPTPAPAPAARSAAGRWAGRSPLPRATRQCPAVPRAASGHTKPHSPPRCSLPELVPSPRSSVAAGPLSWLPPAPGLSQVGGAQPGSQWQWPWLLHTWVGDTEPQSPAAGSPRVPSRPTAHPVPVALAPALLVAQHRDVLALVLEAHLRWDTASGPVRTENTPGTPPQPSRSPSRGRRLCRAAPWLHRSRPRPRAARSPGRSPPLGPHGHRHAGTAASRSQHPCGDQGSGAQTTRMGTVKTGTALTAGHRRRRSHWGAARSAHVRPLSHSERPCRSWRQGWHLRQEEVSPSPPHQAAVPAPSPPYLAPGAAGTAPRRWHRRRRSSAPAPQRRAARPAGRR